MLTIFLANCIITNISFISAQVILPRTTSLKFNVKGERETAEYRDMLKLRYVKAIGYSCMHARV